VVFLIVWVIGLWEGRSMILRYIHATHTHAHTHTHIYTHIQTHIYTHCCYNVLQCRHTIVVIVWVIGLWESRSMILRDTHTHTQTHTHSHTHTHLVVTLVLHCCYTVVTLSC
jgi:hypothetical protein